MEHTIPKVQMNELNLLEETLKNKKEILRNVERKLAELEKSSPQKNDELEQLKKDRKAFREKNSDTISDIDDYLEKKTKKEKIDREYDNLLTQDTTNDKKAQKDKKKLNLQKFEADKNFRIIETKIKQKGLLSLACKYDKLTSEIEKCQEDIKYLKKELDSLKNKESKLQQKIDPLKNTDDQYEVINDFSIFSSEPSIGRSTVLLPREAAPPPSGSLHDQQHPRYEQQLVELENKEKRFQALLDQVKRKERELEQANIDLEVLTRGKDNETVETLTAKKKEAEQHYNAQLKELQKKQAVLQLKEQQLQFLEQNCENLKNNLPLLQEKKNEIEKQIKELNFSAQKRALSDKKQNLKKDIQALNLEEKEKELETLKTEKNSPETQLECVNEEIL